MSNLDINRFSSVFRCSVCTAIEQAQQCLAYHRAMSGSSEINPLLLELPNLVQDLLTTTGRKNFKNHKYPDAGNDHTS